MKLRPVDWLKMAATIAAIVAFFVAYAIWGDHTGGGGRGPRMTP